MEKKIKEKQETAETSVIVGIPSKEDKLMVQKSKPLYSLWKSGLTLSEFKIMDSYLARIDSHNPDRRCVRFEKGQLEQLLGVKKINIADLKERLKNLMETIEIDPDGVNPHFVNLFEEAIATQDKDGLWTVSLECTQKAMMYFFNIENLGYLRYKLRCITSLNSRYSYILFIYIESNRFRKTWEVEIDEIKKILDCEDVQSYEQYKNFNKLLLKRCYNELQSKTECKFTYEAVKRGRNVVGIRFTVDDLPKIATSGRDIEDAAQEHDFMILSDEIDREKETIAFLQDAVPEFSESEVKEIRELLIQLDEDKLPYVSVGISSDIEFRWYHYLQQRYATLKTMEERTEIKNKFKYFLRMVQNDIRG